MITVGIVDYQMGNLDSVSRAVEVCGCKPLLTDKKEDLATVDSIIIPGVGSFHEGMAHIKKSGLDYILKENVIKEKIPTLGICLGMQLLATNGSEGGKIKGLGFIEGEVKLIDSCQNENIPHIGWNSVNLIEKSPLFLDIPSGKDFYFAHSYHFQCEKKYTIATTPYCGSFSSVIQENDIYGVQFHPEKSQKVGLMLIENFLMI